MLTQPINGGEGGKEEIDWVSKFKKLAHSLQWRGGMEGS